MHYFRRLLCLAVASFSFLGAEHSVAEKAGTVKLEEIIVTAQKRSQSVRDVPLSMTVMSANFIKDAGVDNLRDIAKFTPNVEINPELRSAKMRGIGGSAGALVEPAVALVVDGIFYGRSTYLFLSVLDINRVEVLRGPQGLIVGKNASAGALTFYSNKPNYEPSLNLDVQIGSLDERKGDVVLNMPIVSERLALRLALSDHRRDGAFYNTTLDNQDGDLDSFAGRASLLFDINDNIEASLVYGHADRFQSVALSQFTIASDQALIIQGTFDDEFEGDPTDYQSSHNFPEWRHHDGDWASAELSWDFDNFMVTAVSGWADSFDAFQVDGDSGPAPLMTVFGDENYRQMSHEFRIVSNPGRFEYTAGLFVFHSELSGYQTVEIGTLDSVDIASVLGGGEGVFDIVKDLAALPSAVIVDGYFDLETDAHAVFAQLNYKYGDKLSFTGGARYTEEKKSMKLERDNKPDGAELALELALNAEEFTEYRTINESDVSWSLSTTYELNDDISTYITRSLGFKSGGFNSAALQVDNIEYEPEESNTWEAGVKGRYFDGVLVANVGLYRTDFENMQVLTRRPGALNGLVASNAAAARVQGVEADAMLALSRNARLFATLAYNDTEFLDYKDAQCTEESDEDSCDLSGRTLPDAPLWKGSLSVSNRWDIPWMNLQARLRLDALYSGFEYQTLDLDPLDSRDEYWEFNASLKVAPADGRWSITIQQFNITDELIQLSSGDVPLSSGSHAASFDLPKRTVAKLSVEF